MKRSMLFAAALLTALAAALLATAAEADDKASVSLAPPPGPVA